MDPYITGTESRDTDDGLRNIRDKLALLVSAAHPLLFPDLENDSSSSSSDEEIMCSAQKQPPRLLPKTRSYFSQIEVMDEQEFRSHFRLGFCSFNRVVDIVMQRRDPPYSGLGLTDKQRTLIALYFLANRASYRQVSQQFGVSISTAYDMTRIVVEALLTNLGEFIKLPSSMAEIEDNADGFGIYGFPNVYGAIDGSSITVTVPTSKQGDYITRKHVTALNLIALCDSSKRFLDINVGQSEKCHDSHIFHMSNLARRIFNDNIIPPQYHIIGDAAYGLHRNIMTPYKGTAGIRNELYNNRHSSTRMVVERIFSDLKNRWLCLKALSCDVSFATQIVAACCILHNICISNKDIAPTRRDIEVGSGNQIILYNGTPESKRDAISSLFT